MELHQTPTEDSDRSKRNKFDLIATDGQSVLRRAGWALPRPLFLFTIFFTIKKINLNSLFKYVTHNNESKHL
jgi:hypothetical protein